MSQNMMPEIRVVGKTLLWNFPFILIFLISTFLASMQETTTVWMHTDTNTQQLITLHHTMSATKVPFISPVVLKSNVESFHESLLWEWMFVDSRYQIHRL